MCDLKCLNCNGVSTCPELRFHLNECAEKLHLPEGLVEVTEKFWRVKFSCPSNGKCCTCAIAKQCLPLWLKIQKLKESVPELPENIFQSQKFSPPKFSTL